MNEITIVNWEVRGIIPRDKNLRKKLARNVEGAGKSLSGDRLQLPNDFVVIISYAQTSLLPSGNKVSIQAAVLNRVVADPRGMLS